MYAIRSYYVWRYTPSSNDDRGDYGLSGTWELFFLSPQLKDETVITSYSIHYTKLYDENRGGSAFKLIDMQAILIAIIPGGE